MKNRIYLSPPHMCGMELVFVKEAFDSNWIAPLGAYVNNFEKDICEYTGVKNALALSSGTSGIHLALKYLGVEQDDFVFCSSLTFSGSCNPIMYEKAIPVFIDAEPETWNMSPIALEKAFDWAKKNGRMPKAVIVVNLYGQSADWDKIIPICEKYKVPIIEDAAESLGSSYNGRQTGGFGYFGIFSFNGNKIITTSGGGMVVSDDEAAIGKLRFWATQSREPARHYEHKEIGYNYRMSNICAAIGCGQMKALDERIEAKKKVYIKYKKGLGNLPVRFLPVSHKCSPNYWLTVISIDPESPVSPNDIITSLENENIESRPLWKPMHLQPVFQGFPYFKHNDSISTSDDLFMRGVCLPSGTAMTESEQERVISTVRSNW